MAGPRCACVDIGSNTTRLLVAEIADGHLHELLSQRAFTHLGAGREPDDSIPAAKITQLAHVVASQVRHAREIGSHRIRVVATAALRSAVNRDALVAAVEQAAGVPVAVLSAEEEARFAFTGVTRMLPHAPVGEVGVVDVGGGSTELVCGTVARGVSWFVSFLIGSGLLADHHLHSDPPSAAELHAMREHIARVFESIQTPPRSAAYAAPRMAYAVGGGATSLRRLVGADIEPGALARGLRVLSGTPIADVARRFELDPERVRLLPAGILLLERASVVLGVPLRIAGGGLREGIVLEDLEHLAR
jgi:exopolyphosphatase/guanosine-5'-triphosphate,3'-diphosphate pyrophosphatase